jgi:hypothetical protein
MWGLWLALAVFTALTIYGVGLMWGAQWTQTHDVVVEYQFVPRDKYPHQVTETYYPRVPWRWLGAKQRETVTVSEPYAICWYRIPSMEHVLGGRSYEAIVRQHKYLETKT